MSTESVLKDWRFGTTQAERLVAALLHLDGYYDVDPQHPLGGPDGLKDVVCQRGPNTFIAAAYFPTTAPTFNTIRNKFLNDYEGVSANGADGFCFFVNQPVSISDREVLLKAVDGSEASTRIYHLERMRALLDSAQGCGVRLEYLRIAMTEEEQFAFWSGSAFKLNEQLQRIESEQQRTNALLLASMDSLIARTSLMHSDLRSGLSSLQAPPSVLSTVGFPTAQLTTPLLCWLHRLVVPTDGSGGLLAGQLRTSDVWVGTLSGSDEPYVPPSPLKVPELLDTWATRWRALHSALATSPTTSVIHTLTRFYHEFLQIHPFFDGNGRMADTFLDQAARELLQRSLLGRVGSDDPAGYHKALESANAGVLEPLELRITAALS